MERRCLDCNFPSGESAFEATVDHWPSLTPCWNTGAAVLQLSSYFAESTSSNHDSAAITAASTLANSLAVVVLFAALAVTSSGAAAGCGGRALLAVGGAGSAGAVGAFVALVCALEQAPSDTDKTSTDRSQ